MKRRWFKLWVLVFALLSLPYFLVVLVLVFERVRGQRALAAYNKQLLLSGETLDIAAHRGPRVPNAEDGLPEVLRLFSKLPKNSPMRSGSPKKMEMLSPALARPSFLLTQWVSIVGIDQTVTNDWGTMEIYLKANEATLAALRIALQKKGFNSTNDYSLGFGSGIGPLAQMKSLAPTFSTAACDALHQGEREQALDNIVAQLNTMRTIDNNRVAITEMVREAISTIGFATTWEALQVNGWNDSQLTSLQEAWEKVSHLTNMVQAIEGERAVATAYYGIYAKSNDKTYQSMSMTLGRDFGGSDDLSVNSMDGLFRKQIFTRVWRFSWLQQDEVRYFQGLDYLMRKTAAYSSVPDLEL
ncbi:MAG: hypothetical protein JWN25_2777, partial [Verrucomicrobiales bacterium]|nr:hypothetical protein [Verrucomicrobiales bacterium]